MAFGSALFALIAMGAVLEYSFVKALSIDSNTRRSFLTNSAVGVACVLPVGEAKASALDPPTSGGPLVPGGAARFKPEIDSLEKWSPPTFLTQMGRSRLGASELSPLQPPGLGLEQELYYAPFLFGAWNVTATLTRKYYPYGTFFLPSSSLQVGSPRNRDEKVGNKCQYEVHYFSTIANTLANQLSVNLGQGVPKPSIIQDRAYNAVSISKAYQQLAPVQEVEWDYRDKPTRVVLNFGAGLMTEDLRPLGPRRTEIFLNARQAESLNDSVFAAAERSRSVTLAPGAAIVSDTETITEFQLQDDDHVTAVSRIAVYLSPNPNSREGVLWQQVGGKAVAFYDYEIGMSRIKEQFTSNDGSIQDRACVLTPKDVIQCA